jgi:hypothetical protein
MVATCTPCVEAVPIAASITRAIWRSWRRSMLTTVALRHRGLSAKIEVESAAIQHAFWRCDAEHDAGRRRHCWRQRLEWPVGTNWQFDRTKFGLCRHRGNSSEDAQRITKMLNVSRRCSTPQLEHLRAHEHLRIEWMVRSSSQVCCPVMPRDATRDPRVVLISRDIELHCSMSQGITWVSSKTYRAVLFQRWIRLTINLKARHQVRRPAAHLAHQPAVRLFIAPSSPAECKRPM